MQTEITFRTLQETDTQEVYEVALESWRYTYDGIFDKQFIEEFVKRNYAPEVSIQLLSGIQSGQQFFHVAVSAITVVGFCHIAVTKQDAELLRIYLRPSYIGRGIGRQLLKLGEAYIKAQGYNTYFCFVHEKNELGKRFYLRNGFSHSATKDRADEWYMKKKL